MSLYKMEEWKASSGNWYCNCVSNLGGGSGSWWIPARILEMPLDEFVKLLISKFKVSDIKYFEDKNLLLYSWKKQSDMRIYKNFVNKVAREKNFQI